jgi:uncharacterized protein with FMN-binding domain
MPSFARVFVSTRLVICAAVVAACTIAASEALGDTIELTSGQTYGGRMVKRDERFVTFEVHSASGGRSVLSFPVARVRNVVVDGTVPEPAHEPAKPEAPAVAVPAAPKADAESRAGPKTDVSPVRKSPTAGEIDVMIDAAGRSAPDWFNGTPLNYPDTLDLTWKQHPGGWQPNKNLGAYIWGVIQPNPRRWRGGIKLMHHALTVNKDEPARLRQTQEALGRMYLKFEKDYARSAFWYRQAGAGNSAELAECYWRLGSDDMAAGLLAKAPASASVVRVWSAMGRHDTAIRVASQWARQSPGPGNLAAGEANRSAGKYDQALVHFQKAADSARRNKKIGDVAKASIEAIRLYETFDASKLSDGTFKGASRGYRGDVEVAVTIKAGRIEAVRVTRHKEDGYFFNLANNSVPASIVERQQLGGVDAVSGATFTSNAIINATAKALSQALK